MEVAKETGIPLLEGWTNGLDLPHTITTAITYRARINSFNELTEDKRPPRNLWDKPWRLSQFFDEMFNSDSKPSSKGSTKYFDINTEEVE